MREFFQVKQLKKSHLFAVLCNLLVSGGNTLSPLVMAADDQCETAGISLRDEGSEGTTWKVLLVIILFFTALSRDKVDLRMLSQQKDQADAGRVW